MLMIPGWVVPIWVGIGRARIRVKTRPAVGEVEPEYRNRRAVGDRFLRGRGTREHVGGVLLFALGAVLFAVRGYLNTGDRAVAWALIFVALVAIGIEAIVYFMGP